MKKSNFIIIKLSLTLFIGLIFSYSYIQNYIFLENLNNKFYDLFFNLRELKNPSKDIIIVDINEKSLSFFGGFSRDKLSVMIDNLSDAEVSVIGLDLTFPGHDKSSPKRVLKKLGLEFENAIDYDDMLAKSFRKSPLVSGYIFDFSSTIIKGVVPNHPSVFIEKNYNQQDYLPNADGVISNISILQNSVSSSGFFNIISDQDGIVRSSPLIIKYKNSLYPSLALEVVRKYLKKDKIVIDYSPAGISDVSLDDFLINTDRFGRVMINFKSVSKSYKYISALDVYDNSFKKEYIKNSIVLIGASTSRFYDLRATPLDSTFGGVEIHANVIDNIINRDFLIKPNWVETFDIAMILAVVSLIFIFSLFGPAKNTILSLLAMIGFFYVNFFIFTSFGLILSIILPLISGLVLYIILTFLNYLEETKQKDFLNRKLFLEMKDRHDMVENEVKERTDDLQVALQEKTILLRELHHRVKNNLQLVLSIARLQEHGIKDIKIKEEFEKLQNRIKSIARTHEMLCDSDDISHVDMNEYIGGLSEEMESSIAQNNITMDLNITATLPLRQAVYVGLIVNELMSNSIKHAFDSHGGEIYVFLSQEENEYILKIGDSGKGYDENSIRSGSLGLKLVNSLAKSQLDGTIELHKNENFYYTIMFKLVDGE